MGRVRCVKPKGDAGSTNRTVKKKVAWKKKVKVGIKGRTRILPQ